MAEGLLWYFPNALAEVARVSKRGNDQHNPGEPMHHARGKSPDHADCIMRHLVDAGKLDVDGMRHTAKVAWRALALLQEELERDERLPLPRNAMPPPPQYNPDDVAFRSPLGDLAADSQRFGLYGDPKDALVQTRGWPTDRLIPPPSTDLLTAHPMAAEGLRMADEQPCNQPGAFPIGRDGNNGLDAFNVGGTD